MVRYLCLGLLAVLSSGAEPTGHLVYLSEGQAWVLDLSQGEPLALPSSDGLGEVTVLPSTGEAFYIAGGVGGKPIRCARPYRMGKAWSIPTTGVYPAFAGPDGRNIFLATEDGGGRFDVPADAYTPLPYRPLTCDAGGGLIGYQGEKTIELNRPASGETKVVFSIGQPKPLFEALQKAKFPAQLKDLTDAIDPELYKDQNNWGFGPPALTPDGERVFFAVNGGVSLGVAGNTTWCLVVSTVADGAILPLSKVGTFYGRLPHLLQVSPDSRHLLMLTSFHNNAVENPCQAYIIDLYTQQMHELLWSDKRLMAIPNLVNVTSGACWSPDGQYVAVSASYYDGEAAIKADNFELEDDSFVTTIYDAETGTPVRYLKGAQQPAWGQ